jgi:hypothetical protein
MTNCAAYKKPSCWLPPAAGSHYCATCQSQSDRDVLERFITMIPTFPENQILPTFLSPEIQRALRTNRTAVIDRLLIALYRRSPTLLTQIISRFRASPTLNANLLLRIRSHTQPGMCAVFGYIVRHSLFPEWMIPRCVTCLSHMIRQTNDPNLPIPNVVTVRRHLEHQNDVSQLLRQALATRLNGEGICLDFLGALVETRILSLRLRQFPVWLTNIQNMMRQLGAQQQQIDAFTERVYHHPFLLQFTEPSRRFLKRRMAPWKEELTAKGWHPSRFLQWCLDQEEQKEFAGGGCEILSYRCEPLPAAWNISWR